LPGARGEVQVVPVRSPARINCSIASWLASRAVLISDNGPLFPDNHPGQSYASSGATPRHDALRSRKRILISGGSVDRWHGHVEQSQVDEQLSPMVIPVIEQERPENGGARCRN
jgi:hypothetical protein